MRIDTFRIFCATAAKYNHKLCGIDFEGAYLQSDIDAEIHIQLPNELYDYAAQIGLTSADIGHKGDVFY